MEYYLCRLFEVNRLSATQIDILHGKESKIGRALMPFEIQEIFGLNTIKEHYQWPETCEGLSERYVVLRAELKNRQLSPVGGDFSVADIEDIHKWDARLKRSLEAVPVDLFGTSRKKRLASRF